MSTCSQLLLEKFVFAIHPFSFSFCSPPPPPPSPSHHKGSAVCVHGHYHHHRIVIEIVIVIVVVVIVVIIVVVVDNAYKVQDCVDSDRCKCKEAENVVNVQLSFLILEYLNGENDEEEGQTDDLPSKTSSILNLFSLFSNLQI